MTLAKALKQKNRLAQKISGLQSEIQRENSARSDDPRKINVEELMGQLEKVKEDLIKLKIVIFVASTPMRESILRLGELKAHIAFLRSMGTREGKVNDYSDAEIEYTVVFDKVYVKTEIEKSEAEIDDTQDELDTFNHKTEVSV